MKRILASLLSFALCLALLLFVRNESDEPILHVALKSASEQDAAYVYETVYASGKSRACDAFTPDACVFTPPTTQTLTPPRFARTGSTHLSPPRSMILSAMSLTPTKR